jgi:hypothetical protein
VYCYRNNNNSVRSKSSPDSYYAMLTYGALNRTNYTHGTANTAHSCTVPITSQHRNSIMYLEGGLVVEVEGQAGEGGVLQHVHARAHRLHLGNAW